MTESLHLAAWITVVVASALVLYVYFGYPLLLLVKARRPRPIRFTEHALLPNVTLIISAYNEEGAIGQKLRNSIALDYPRSAIEILVVSDCSTDRTDDIVRSFEGDGIRLIRMPDRRGKTAGLNEAVARAHGDILVFSDANAFYRPDAIRMLARNFQDPQVGCVTGESRYLGTERSHVGEQEGLYWSYERHLKIWESAAGSMVGSDGAVFALRRTLFRPLHASDLNDFVVPLQVVQGGLRCIYEPLAICQESVEAHYGEEFRRKVRVVNRSVYALRRTGSLLNPFRYGFFTLELVSHKLLRWCIGFLLLAILAASALLATESFIARVLLACQLVFYVLSASGVALVRTQTRWIRKLTLPTYFCLVNVAAMWGVITGLLGRVQVIWSPERGVRPRHRSAELTGAVAFGLLIAIPLLAMFRRSAVPVLWIAGALLTYIYVGYPILIRLASAVLRRGVSGSRQEPSVTLLILAYNEAEVLPRKLTNSLALDYPRDRLRVLVVSDGSDDETNSIVHLFGGHGVELLALRERVGKAGAIGAALPQIESELVVFSDANVLYDADAIRNLVRYFADPTVGAVSGNVALLNDHLFYRSSEALYTGFERFLYRHETRAGTMVGVDGAMYGIRKDYCRPPRLGTILDDLAIGMGVVREGKRIVFAEDARGWEVSSPNASAEAERRARVVAGGMQTILHGEGLPRVGQVLIWIQYLSHKVFRWFTPVLLFCILAASVSLSGQPLYRFLLTLQLGFYILAAHGAITRRRTALSSVPFYVTLEAFAAAIGLYHGLLSRQEARWKMHPRLNPPPDRLPAPVVCEPTSGQPKVQG